MSWPSTAPSARSEPGRRSCSSNSRNCTPPSPRSIPSLSRTQEPFALPATSVDTSTSASPGSTRTYSASGASWMPRPAMTACATPCTTSPSTTRSTVTLRSERSATSANSSAQASPAARSVTGSPVERSPLRSISRSFRTFQVFRDRDENLRNPRPRWSIRGFVVAMREPVPGDWKVWLPQNAAPGGTRTASRHERSISERRPSALGYSGAAVVSDLRRRSSMGMGGERTTSNEQASAPRCRARGAVVR